MIRAYFDSACGPMNPKGVAAWGIVIKDGNEVIHTDYGLACEPYTDLATNNTAEYTALIEVLKALLDASITTAEVYGDSKLVVNLFNGDWKAHMDHIKEMDRVAKGLKKQFRQVRAYWIPREENTEADDMSKKYYLENKI